MPATSSATPVQRNSKTTQPPITSAGQTPQSDAVAGRTPSQRLASRNRTVSQLPADPSLNARLNSAATPEVQTNSLHTRQTSQAERDAPLSPREHAEPARTGQELANLAERREFRDKSIMMYGEEAVTAAFKSFNVALKGEGKFALLDKKAQRQLKCASQAHYAAIDMMERSIGITGRNNLSASGETDIYKEALRNQVRAHPSYGKAVLDNKQASVVWQAAHENIELLHKHLNQEVKLERYLSNIMGHGAWDTPISLEQAIVDHEQYNYHQLAVSDDEKAALKLEFRRRAANTGYFEDLGRAFIGNRVPNYLNKRLLALENTTKAQGAQAIEFFKQLLPREIIREIVLTLWAVFQSGMRPKPAPEED